MEQALQSKLHQVDRRSRLLNWVVGAVAMLAFVAVGLVVMWSSAPSQVIEIKTLPVPVVSKRVARDELILQRYDFCKLANARGEIERTLVSSTTALVLPATDEVSEKRCYSDAVVPAVIPGQAQPDVYRLHYKATYHLNPIKTVKQEWNTEPFEVVAENSDR